jgi:hypothetical protein
LPSNQRGHWIDGLYAPEGKILVIQAPTMSTVALLDGVGGLPKSEQKYAMRVLKWIDIVHEEQNFEYIQRHIELYRSLLNKE